MPWYILGRRRRREQLSYVLLRQVRADPSQEDTPMNLAARRSISGYLFMGAALAFLLWIPAFWYWSGGWSQPSLLHVLSWYWWAGLLILSFLLIAAGTLITPKVWEGRNRFTTALDDDDHRLHVDPDATKVGHPEA